MKLRRISNPLARIVPHFFQFLLLASTSLFLVNCILFTSAQTSFFARTSVVLNATDCPSSTDVRADAVTGVVYVTCLFRVLAISGDTATPIIEPVSGCVNPTRLTTNIVTGELFVICAGTGGVGGSIMSYRNSSAQILADTSDCPSPVGIYADSVSRVVYVACKGSATAPGKVIAINGTSISTIANSTQCSSPGGVSGNPQTGRVFATCGRFDGRLIEISPDLTIRTLYAGDNCVDPSSITCNVRTGAIYLTCTDVLGGSSGGVLMIDGTSSKVIANSFQCPAASNVHSIDETGVVYASCYGSGRAIAIVDHGVLPMDTGCSLVSSLTSNPKTGLLYAACDTGGLMSLQPTTLTSIAPPLVCQNPRSLAVNTNTGAVYAVCGGSDPRTVEILGTIVRTVLTEDQCSQASSIYYNATTDVMYVACRSTDAHAGYVVAVRGSSVILLANSTQCPGPTDIDANTRTGSLYVACSGSMGQVIEITPTSVTPFPTLNVCPQPINVRFNQATNSVVVACGSPILGMSSILQIELSNGNNITTFAPSEVCPIGAGLTSSPSGDVFLACTGGGIWKYDGRNFTQLLALRQCFQPSDVFADPTSGIIYVACDGDAVFGAVHTSAFALIPYPSETVVLSLATVDDCKQPAAIVSDPSTGIAYISCSSNDAFGVFSVTVSQNCPLGYSFSQSNGFGCVLCDSGFFRNYSMAQQNSIACRACEPGAVMPDQGSMQCNICPASTFVVSSRLSCGNCTLGWFSSSPGSSHCSPCDSGYFGSTPGSASTCSGPCSAGYWCSSGSSNATQVQCGSRSVFCPEASSAPTPVSPGMWSTNSTDGSDQTMSAQQPCLLGSFCDGSGLYKPCFAGTFQNRTGQSTCRSCDPGTVSAEGASACTPCRAGYTSSAGSTVCTPCPPGTYLNASMSRCANCAIGKYASDQASTSCSDCPPGQVASAAGSSYCRVCSPGFTPVPDPLSGILACSACPPGTASQDGAPCNTCGAGRFAPYNASYSCTLCSQGSASDVIGRATPCTLCAPGSYQSFSGQSVCFSCAPQYYSSSPGAIACQFCTAQVTPNRTECSIQVCPLNHIYGDDGLCHVCDLGMVGNGVDRCQACASSFYTPMPGAACTSCSSIDGLICSSGLASVAEGYWAYLLPANAEGIQLYATTKCPPQYCPGSQLQVSNYSSTDSLLAIEYCKFPRLNSPTNTLCGQCIDGYIPWGDGCAPCSGVNGGLVFGLLVLSTAVILFLLRSGGKAAGSVTVLLYFVQIAALEIGAVSQWFNWLQVFNFKPTSISTCLAVWTPYQQTLFSMFIPIILLGEVVFIACVHLALHKFMKSNPSAVGSPNAVYRGLAKLVATFSWNTYVGGSMSVLLFCYTQVATTIMQYLFCIHVGDQLLMFTSPTVDCRSSTYRSYLALVIFFLVFYILGYPLAMVGLLWKYKSLLAASIDRSKPLVNDTLTIVQRWGPLFAMYEPQKAWFWQSLVLLRRALFALISALLVQQGGIRFMLFSIIHFLSLQVHVFVQPYASKTSNNAETVSYGLLVLLSLLLTGYQPPPYPTFVQVFVMLLVVPPATAWAFYVIQEQWLELALKLQGGAAAADAAGQEAPNAVQECSPADIPSSSHVLAPAEVGIELAERQADGEGFNAASSNTHLTNGAIVASDSTEL